MQESGGRSVFQNADYYPPLERLVIDEKDWSLDGIIYNAY
jgi:hypothetical protein